MAGINLSALSDYFKYPEKVAELRVRLYKILVDKNVEVDANASLNTLIDKVREVEGNIEENTIYLTENNTTEGYDVTNYTKAIVDVQAQVEENELDKLLDNTIESFIMPQSINYLGPYKFYQCTYLSEIQANSLMNIENYVFYGCSNLESANFPYVTSIGYKAFTNCTSLQELSVPEVVTIQSEALQNIPNLRKLDFPNLVYVLGSSTTATATVTSADRASYLSIPYVTSLSSNCFLGLNAVNSIYAPNLISIYGSYAIYGGNNSTLSILDFPLLRQVSSHGIINFNNVKTINAPLLSLAGFTYMSEVSRVSFPYLRQFSPWAFYGFNDLEEVDFPYITHPSWVQQQMSGLFKNCYNLSRIYLPRMTSGEFYDSFTGCSSLKELEFPLLGYANFNYNNTSTTGGFWNTNLESFSAPRLTNGNFTWVLANKSTLRTVNLSNCSSIYSSMFINDTALESIIMWNALNIGSSAFFGCSSLKEIYFTGNIIFNQAFVNCTSLGALYLLNANRVTLYASAFLNTPFTNSNLLGEYGKIYVPSSLYSSYINASFWSELAPAITSMPSEIENNYILAQQYDVSALEQENKSTAERILASAFMTTAVSQANHSMIKYVERDAYRGCANLFEISLPNVEEIAYSAFWNCQRLTSVYLPKVKYIGYGAFTQNGNISGTLDLPEVITIDRYAFSSQSRITSLNAPKAETIASNAFYNCSNLNEVNLSSVKLIDYYAFYSCSRLNSLNLPEVEFIGSYAFYNCSNISQISLPKCKVIEEGAFYSAKISEVNLPEAEVISGAFQYNSNLKTISAPKAKIICGWAFSSCSRLTDVYIPEARILDYAAFASCYSLSSVYAPKVSYIGSQVFAYCSSLSEINFSNVRCIYSSAFSYCGNLTYASLPEVRKAGMYTFLYCTKLSSIYAPHLTDLDQGTFYGCSSITEIPNQDKLTTIPYECFGFCAGLSEVDLPVCSILSSNGFYNCKNLTTISIPQVRQLGYQAFYSCSKLQSISNNFIGRLWSAVFYSCSSISTIYLPRVSIVSHRAFYGCSNLTDLIIDFSKLSVIEEYTFAGCEKLDIFNISSYWSNITEIRSGAFSNCRYLTSMFNTSQSFIYDYTYQGTNIYEINNSLITSIGISALAENSQLSTVSLENCNFIGSYAFQSCTSLSDIQLSSSYTYLGQYAFADTKLSSIDSAAKQYIETSKYVPSGLYRGTEIAEITLDGIENIYREAFRSCNSLTTLSLSTVTSISDTAFANCENLSEIFLPNIDYIGNSAFQGCTNLSSINLPLDLAKISLMQSIFQDCVTLSYFDFRNAKTVPAGMFRNCQNLISLNMENIQYFSANAVANCSKLESIYLPVCASMNNVETNMYQSNKALRTVWTPLTTYITDGVNYQNLPNLREVLTPGYYMLRGNYIGCNALESFYYLGSNSTQFSNVGSSYWSGTPMVESSYLGYYGSFYVFSKWRNIMANNYGGYNYRWISERIASLPDSIERQFLHAYELSNVENIPANKLNAEYIIGTCPSSQFTISYLSLSKVKLINNGAFYNCRSLKEINFPEAKIIQYNAFGYCLDLSSIYLPQATEIQSQAFYRVDALTELNLPNVEIIREYAFSGCSNLSQINLPKVSSIGYSAFQWCSCLTAVNLPFITYIGGNAFNQCSAISEVYLSFQGKNCNLDYYVFGNCTNIKEITLNFNNGILRSEINSQQQFNGCYSIENINIIGSSIQLSGGNYPALSRLLYGASAENLYANDLISGWNTYYMCAGFKVKNVEMNNLEMLSSYACYNNNWLERAKFKKIKTLGTYAFYNCTKLPYIEFPNLISLSWGTSPYGSAIVQSTFTSCSQLSIIVFGASKMVSFSASYLYNSCFNNTPIMNSAYLGYFGSFYVPASLLAAYVTDSRWGAYPSRFTTIEDNLSMLQALGLCSNYGTSSYWE